jgi:hypothetical protein
MRSIILAVVPILFATSSAAEMGQPLVRPKALEALGLARGGCPPSVAQQEAKHLHQHDGPLLFHRLDRLPRATAYAAVIRVIDGCEAPLTKAEYIRNQGR